MFSIAASMAILLAVVTWNISYAEEGMFMMDKLDRLPLSKAGLKIKPAEIYNPDGTGLSIAVPRLSIGCSSAFVSPEGLILTNHHCAFDALVSASTTEKNLADIGYRAGSRAEELPAKGYAVDLTLKQEDVTSKVLAGIDAGNAEAVAKRIAELETQEKAKSGPGVRVRIQPLSDGMFFYLFKYQRISDIRVVYAPPATIGYYGGDPDNFEWTRHAGDFTFLRAYVAPDGTSAAYSKQNVPYKPKKYLTVSADGLNEDAYTMIIGYPGRTNRYRESFSVDYNQNHRLPFTIEVLAARVKALELVSKMDEAKAVELQSDIFSLNNVIKAYEGAVLAMRRAKLIKQRQESEVRLTRWINGNSARKTKYGAALPGLKAGYEAGSEMTRTDLMLQNIARISPIQFLSAIGSGVPKDRLKRAVPGLAASEPILNRELFKFLLRKASELPEGQKIGAVEKLFGGLSGNARISAEGEFAGKALENKTVTTADGLNGLLDMSAEQMKASEDPLVKFYNDIAPEMASMNERQHTLGAALNKHRLSCRQPMAEMNNAMPYPDANSTQRFSYGKVKGYSPREAVSYTPFTTLDGIFEKDTGREPFNAPEKLRTLWEKKDYGNHAVNGTIPLDFLTTNDIIGGNSGSPVMNAKGELTGLAFDGNYEGLGNDFFFNPALGRTIVVDIRYIMFLTDKFGDASWVLKEMKINGGNRKAMTAGR
jgi:hypothetical protein